MGIVQKDSPRINTSKLSLGIDLKPHQRALLFDMLQLEKSIFGNPNFHFALMSDKPGAGKTYVVLALIFITTRIIFKNQRSVTLIVVPYNILTQWKQSMEIIFKGTDMKYTTFTDYADISMLFQNTDILKEHDILLTTSLYYDTISTTLRANKIGVDRVFFDEADSIKDLLKTEINSKMVWFVSASIESVFDKNTKRAKIGSYDLELNKLLSYDCRCDPSFVDEHITIPQSKENVIRCDSVYTDDLLLKVVDHTKRDRIHACDYKFLEVEPDLVCDYKTCLKLQYKHVRLDRELMLEIENVKTMMVRGNEREKMILKGDLNKHESALYVCKGVLNKIELFIGKYGLCQECMREHERGSPECVFENPSTTKIEYIQDIIKSLDSKAKCILFSNHDGCYKHLRNFMRSNNIYYGDLDGGNIKDMDHILYAYKKGNMRVLLTDSSMFSCGMNLENTTDIIFVHKMDPLKETQIIGRAQRYGREGSLRIWKLHYGSE